MTPPGLAGKERFVGRQPELAAVEGAFRRAAAGRGTVVTLLGETGSGKTRLLDEVAVLARQRWYAQVWRSGALHGLGTPSHRAGTQPSGERIPRQPTDGDRTPWGADDARQHDDGDAVMAALERACAEDPLLLLLDDLEALDPSSMSLLGHVLTHVHELRVLVVLACREPVPAEAPLSRALALAARLPGAARLTLRGLDRAAVAELVSAARDDTPDDAAGDAVDDAVDDAVVDALLTRTGGNPLFVQELLRLGPGAGRVPPLVVDVVDARVATLPAAARQALALTAVLGRPAELDLLEAVTGSAALLLEGVSAAVTAGLVVLRPDSRLAFVSPLVAEAVYEGLPLPERAALHLSVARELERREAPAAELATHFGSGAALAGTEVAARYAVLAGDDAAAQHAHADAARWYERALDLGAARGAARCRLLLRAAHAHAAAGDVRAATQACTVAAQLARASGDRVLLAEAALGAPVAEVMSPAEPTRLALLEDALRATAPDDHATRARLLSRLGQALYYLGPEDRRQDAVRIAVAEAESSGDPSVLADALLAQRDVLFGPSHLTERTGLAERLLELAAVTGSDELEVLARTARAYDRFEGADLVGGFADLDALEACVVARGLQHHRWRVALHRGVRLAWQGPVEGVREHADDAERLGAPVLGASAPFAVFGLRLQLSRLLDDWTLPLPDVDAVPATGAPVGLAVRAMCLAHQGRREEAGRALRAVGDLRTLRETHAWFAMVPALGDAAALTGEVELAAQIYDLLAPWAGRVVVVARFVGGLGGAADQALGLLAASLGRHEQSRRHFAAAEELYRSTSGRAMLVLLERDRALAAACTGGRPAAASRAETAVRGAGSVDGTAPARPAAAAVPGLLAPLTPREADVLAHVARGLANKQIARALGMSDKTVRNHLTTVFAKLGVADRTQAALLVAGSRSEVDARR